MDWTYFEIEAVLYLLDNIVLLLVEIRNALYAIYWFALTLLIVALTACGWRIYHAVSRPFADVFRGGRLGSRRPN